MEAVHGCRFFLVDAFGGDGARGNPAAVVIHSAPLDDGAMRAVAQEFNQSETAFVQMREGEDADKPLLRWFTTAGEIDLCGHATLASAHVVLSELGRGRVCDLPLFQALCLRADTAHPLAWLTAQHLDETMESVVQREGGADAWVAPEGSVAGEGWDAVLRAGTLDAVDVVSREVTFATRWVGDLVVRRVACTGIQCARKGASAYTMAMPLRPGADTPLAAISPHIRAALHTATTPPRRVLVARDVVLVYDDERTVHELAPDFAVLNAQDQFVCVTARRRHHGDHAHFVSRFFCPNDGMPEDPVTGSAHCTLAPFWAGELGTPVLRAAQVSPRGGHLWLHCRAAVGKVDMTGNAWTVARGEMC